MRCDLPSIVILTLVAPCLMAQPGLGELANNINPLIMYGAGLIQIIMTFLGMIFLVYSYSLWRHHQKNPALTHISSVITAFIVAVSCLFFSFSSFYSEDYTKTQAKPPIRPSITQSRVKSRI